MKYKMHVINKYTLLIICNNNIYNNILEKLAFASKTRIKKILWIYKKFYNIIYITYHCLLRHHSRSILIYFTLGRCRKIEIRRLIPYRHFTNTRLMAPAKAGAAVRGCEGRRGRFIIAGKVAEGNERALLSSNSETRSSHVSGFENGPSRFAASYLNKALCRAGPSPLPKYLYSHACMPICRITVSLSCSFCGFPPFLGTERTRARARETWHRLHFGGTFSKSFKHKW